MLKCLNGAARTMKKQGTLLPYSNWQFISLQCTLKICWPEKCKKLIIWSFPSQQEILVKKKKKKLLIFHLQQNKSWYLLRMTKRFLACRGWLGLWCLAPLSIIFQLYHAMAVSFIGGGNRSTQRKPLTCRKSLTHFFT